MNISEDIEPRLTKVAVIEHTSTTFNLTWQVDLDDAFVEISVDPTDIDMQTFYADSDKILTNLVPGTSYDILLFPVYEQTYGDYVTIHATTEIGDVEFSTEFNIDTAVVQGYVIGRCDIISGNCFLFHRE